MTRASRAVRFWAMPSPPSLELLQWSDGRLARPAGQDALLSTNNDRYSSPWAYSDQFGVERDAARDLHSHESFEGLHFGGGSRQFLQQFFDRIRAANKFHRA